MEASAPAVEGDEAQLITPFVFMNPEKLHCLSFWYHMHGEGTGALQVFVTERGFRSKRKLIWSRIGQQGNQWLNAEVPVSVIYPNYAQIIFRAIRGKTYTSDIGLDQVSLIYGSCGESGLASNITPWKVFGQSVYDTIRSTWAVPENGEKISTTAQSTTQTSTTSQTNDLATTTEPAESVTKVWFCDKKLNVTFNPIDEACCGGQVKKKHKWVRQIELFAEKFLKKNFVATMLSKYSP